jgi:peptidyl-dipeptidase A
MRHRKIVLTILAAAAGVLAAAGASPQAAREFVDKAEKVLLPLTIDGQRAGWVQSTYINDDTQAIASAANQKVIDETVRLVKESRQYASVAGLEPEVARKLNLLRLSLTVAAPANPAESAELARILSTMEGNYGKGKYCRGGGGAGDCLDLEQITRIMASSRDPRELLDVWRGWHHVGRNIKSDFTRYVELSNKGAREIGFADTGAMWRAKYDMPPEAFARELDRLWEQVRPLYLSLHAYVRMKLREKYGDASVPHNGPLPAHLLGNMWAQTWDNVYPLVAPGNADPGYDLTANLKARNTDYKQMARFGESFFTSLGFAPLPPTFWERSMLAKPRDREVVCHASAWDVDLVDDLRIKMCVDITGEDFATVHHELGHNFYQRAYNRQPLLFRDSANDGFHEAIGDTIALSITPEYLVKIGLLDHAPDASKDIGLLLTRALDKIAFLPFGLLIDQWRWKVFSGETPPARYNQTWWELRRKYQGVDAPVARSEADFDPGAKYHVPANYPYSRYFLADILQFQFHRALARTAGCNQPLHRCSIYGSKEAGARLNRMLEMGVSRPWQDALNELTGQREMDASAIRDYFAPLERWLNEQIKGQPVGW